MKTAIREAAIVWLALMVLLALTCGSAFIAMGEWNMIANMAIAAIKALLVALFFMHLKHARPAYRLVAVIALFTLGLLLGLSGTDYATRVVYPAAWQGW
jgi:cytochrome c oxidase subunit 4